MADRKRALLQGNEAVVEGAIAAGMRFFSGYPITPSTEIAERCALRLPQVGGKFIQMEDEIAGMAACIGASVAGVKAMTATSGPGFSLKQENIGYAALAEVPCVVVNVQRSGPSTGLPTSPSQGDYMQARWGTHGDHPVIAISPSSVQETYSEAIRCFNLAEQYRVPVILLMDEIVGHMREGIELLDPDEVQVFNRLTKEDPEQASLPYDIVPGELVPRITPFGEGIFYNMTGLVHDNWGFPTNSPVKANRQCTRIMKKIEKNTDKIEKYEMRRMEDAEVCVVSFGGTARSVEAAIDEARQEEYKVGSFRPVTVWPFPEKAIAEIASRVRHIVVAELNYGQMKLEVERAAAGRCPVSHIGKVNGTILKPSEIFRLIREVAR
ncbi:MAG: 2-oxoacid:acceptor oxidoreductase subunit alpha [Clostridiales bacterium]|jgi:2-oxoglutarate ferredoxin oxidoreductase subunit alpha|nr:2-oxoacid:acceptor oxidoreductase subunit alpha [Clostridiales bacterium]